MKRRLGIFLAVVLALSILPTGLPKKAEAAYSEEDYAGWSDGIREIEYEYKGTRGNYQNYDLSFYYKVTREETDNINSLDYTIKVGSKTATEWNTLRNADLVYRSDDRMVYVYKCKVSDLDVYKSYWGGSAKVTLWVEPNNGPKESEQKEKSFSLKTRMPSYEADGACAFVKSKKVNKASITARVNRDSKYNYFKIVKDGKSVAYGSLPYKKNNTIKERTKVISIPYDKDVSVRVYFAIKKKDQKPKYSKEYVTKKVRSKKIYAYPPLSTKLRGGKVGLDVSIPTGVNYVKIQRFNPNTKKFKTIKTFSKKAYFTDKNPYKKKRYRMVAYKKANNKTYKHTSKASNAYPNKINLGGNPGIASKTMKFKAGMGTVRYSGKNIYVKLTVTNSTYNITRRLSSVRVYLKVGKTKVFDRKFKKSAKMGPRSTKTYTLKITNPKYVNLRRGKITYGAWAYGK